MTPEQEAHDDVATIGRRLVAARAAAIHTRRALSALDDAGDHPYVTDVAREVDAALAGIRIAVTGLEAAYAAARWRAGLPDTLDHDLDADDRPDWTAGLPIGARP